MHIADRSLFLAMARTLWAFDVKRALDSKTGKEIIPDIDNIEDGLFICPKPFEADISPRNQKRAVQVQEEWGKIAELLDDEMQWKNVPEGLKWRDYEPDDEGIDLPETRL